MSYTHKTPLGDKLEISATDDGQVVFQIISALGTPSVPLPVDCADIDRVLDEIREHAIVAGDARAARYKAEGDARRGYPLHPDQGVQYGHGNTQVNTWSAS